jgi:hypothetical protein
MARQTTRTVRRSSAGRSASHPNAKNPAAELTSRNDFWRISAAKAFPSEKSLRRQHISRQDIGGFLIKLDIATLRNKGDCSVVVAH